MFALWQRVCVVVKMVPKLGSNLEGQTSVHACVCVLNALFKDAVNLRDYITSAIN